MARLLAAEHTAFTLERLEHVAVAHVGGDDADAVLAHQLVQSEVRHHGDGDQVDAEIEREHGDDLVAVDEGSVLVDGEHPIAVSVEGDPEVESLLDHRALQERGVGRPAADVDVGAVGLDADRDDLGATLLERLRRNPGVGAVRAVDDDPQPERSAPKRSSTCCRYESVAISTRSTVPWSTAGAAARSASICSSDRSVSFRPRLSKNLTPLYSGGLCDAEMTTPRSSASSATAGVGRTPPRMQSPPAEMTPRANASSSSSPDARVSRPTNTLAAPVQSAAARPRRSTSSGVMDSPTTPRTPSVPKYLRAT